MLKHALSGGLVYYGLNASGMSRPSYLLDDLGDNTGSDGAAALAQGKAHALLHCNALEQFDLDVGVVSGHHHLGAFRQRNRPGDIGSAEEELWLVVRHKRRVSTSLVLLKYINLRLQFLVGGHGSRLGQDLAALDVVTLHTTQENADVVSGLTLLEILVEHLHARTGGHGRGLEADDLEFIAAFNETRRDSTSADRSTSANGEDLAETIK